MVHPQGAVFVIPLRPRRLALPALALTGVLALLLVGRSPTEASYAPVPTDPPPELRLIPSETVAIFHVNLASVLGMELPKTLVPLVMDRDGGVRDFGLPLKEIESFAVLGGRGSTIILTARARLDREKVVTAVVPGGKELTYKEKKIYGLTERWKDGPFRGFKDDFPRDKFADFPKEKAVDKPAFDRVVDKAFDKPVRDFKDRPFDKPLDKPAFDKDAPPANKDTERLDTWSRAVYFLNEKTYVVAIGRDLMHFIDTAEKPDEKSPFAEVLQAAGRHHVTVGAFLPDEVRQGMERGFRFGMGMGGMEAFAYGFKPFVKLKQLVLTGDIGEETRVEGSAVFPDARSAEHGKDAVKLTVEMFKGPLLYVEEQMERAFGEMKPDSALFKLTGELRAALNNAVVKTDGSTVKLSVRAKTEEAAIKEVMTEIAPRLHLAANKTAALNNLKQLSLAIINYADQNDGDMPPDIIYSKDGKPLFSWRVAILPYLDLDPLYKAIRFDEQWDSEHNKKILAKTPRVFQLPGVKEEDGMTHFQIFRGMAAFTTKNGRARFPASFTDGPSQTILVVEAAEAVHWAAPRDIEYSDKVSPHKQVGRHYGKGALASFADGAARLIPETMSEKDFRVYITPNADDVPSRYGFGDEDEERYYGGRKDYDKRGGYKDVPAKDFPRNYDKKDGGFSKEKAKDSPKDFSKDFPKEK